MSYSHYCSKYFDFGRYWAECGKIYGNPPKHQDNGKYDYGNNMVKRNKLVRGVCSYSHMYTVCISSLQESVLEIDTSLGYVHYIPLL